MPSHPLTNCEIQNYNENKSKIQEIISLKERMGNMYQILISTNQLELIGWLYT